MINEAGMSKIAVNALIVSFSIFMVSCSSKYKKHTVFVDNQNLYGMLANGIPREGTYIEFDTLYGKHFGSGKYAVAQNGEISNLKFGFWKEFDEEGNLNSEGNYKISSYIDCSVGGAIYVYYFYRSGRWRYFKSNGQLAYELEFKPKPHHIETNCEGGDDLIFGIADQIDLKYNEALDVNQIFELQKTTIEYSGYLIENKPMNGKIFTELKFK